MSRFASLALAGMACAPHAAEDFSLAAYALAEAIKSDTQSDVETPVEVPVSEQVRHVRYLIDHKCGVDLNFRAAAEDPKVFRAEHGPLEEVIRKELQQLVLENDCTYTSRTFVDQDPYTSNVSAIITCDGARQLTYGNGVRVIRFENGQVIE